MTPSQLNETDIAFVEACDTALKVIRPSAALKSGIGIAVANLNDWVTFTEIFASQSYDEAITDALFSSDTPKTVVDLGANVGYFTLRCADLWLKHPKKISDLSFVCVEGSPPIAQELQNRISNQSLLKNICAVHTGLVGERSGSAQITNYPNHSYNSITPYQGGIFDKYTEKMDVSYLDLTHLIQAERIDLLKCDIEGSEQAFLKNYPNIMSKTQNCVIEFHTDRCDLTECLSLFAQYGFRNSRELLSHPINPTYYFKK